MTENRSYHCIQGQGHLGHMTLRWTRLVLVHKGLLKGGGVNFLSTLLYLFK